MEEMGKIYHNTKVLKYLLVHNDVFYKIIQLFLKGFLQVQLYVVSKINGSRAVDQET